MRVEVDREARIVGVDEEARRILELPDVDGVPWIDAFVPDRLTGAWWSMCEHVVAGGKAPHDITIPVRLRSGREVAMTWDLDPKRDRDGRITGIVMKGAPTRESRPPR